MATVYFHLGKGRVRVDIPDSNLLGVYTPAERKPVGSAGWEVRRSLSSPIGSEPIPNQIRGGDKVLVVLDDHTRQTPARAIVPGILDELFRAGIDRRDVEFVFALGTHRYMTMDEMVEKAGRDVMESFRVFNHHWREQSMLVDLGSTRSGIPIEVNRKLVEADWSIGVGNIVAHRVAGYTGGAKIVQPGLSGAATTAGTHLIAGEYPGEEILGKAENPVRREMEEIGRKAGLSMIFNTVLDAAGRMIGAFAGDMVEAHRKGVELSEQIYGIQIPCKADVVVIDSHPADSDMWQAVKAIEAAELATKPGGTIVLLSPCLEGISSEHPELERYGYMKPAAAKAMMEEGKLEDPVAVAAMIHVGGILERFRVISYTIGIDKKETETLGFEYAPSAQEAVDRALRDAGPSAEVIAFKRGAEIVPKVGGR